MAEATNTSAQKGSKRMFSPAFIPDDFGSKALVKGRQPIFMSARFAIQPLFVKAPGPGESFFVPGITQTGRDSGQENTVSGKQQIALGNCNHHRQHVAETIQPAY